MEFAEVDKWMIWETCGGRLESSYQVSASLLDLASVDIDVQESNDRLSSVVYPRLAHAVAHGQAICCGEAASRVQADAYDFWVWVDKCLCLVVGTSCVSAHEHVLSKTNGVERAELS